MYAYCNLIHKSPRCIICCSGDNSVHPCNNSSLDTWLWIISKLNYEYEKVNEITNFSSQVGCSQPSRGRQLHRNCHWWQRHCLAFLLQSVDLVSWEGLCWWYWQLCQPLLELEGSTVSQCTGSDGRREQLNSHWLSPASYFWIWSKLLRLIGANSNQVKHQVKHSYSITLRKLKLKFLISQDRTRRANQKISHWKQLYFMEIRY